MIKKLFFLPLFLNFLALHAQTVKTDVLVIGAGPSGLAAAIQSARSNAKTVLIGAGDFFTYSSIKNGIDQNNLAIKSGFWREFRDSLTSHSNKNKGGDTSSP